MKMREIVLVGTISLFSWFQPAFYGITYPFIHYIRTIDQPIM